MSQSTSLRVDSEAVAKSPGGSKERVPWPQMPAYPPKKIYTESKDPTNSLQTPNQQYLMDGLESDGIYGFLERLYNIQRRDQIARNFNGSEDTNLFDAEGTVPTSYSDDDADYTDTTEVEPAPKKPKPPRFWVVWDWKHNSCKASLLHLIQVRPDILKACVANNIMRRYYTEPDLRAYMDKPENGIQPAYKEELPGVYTLLMCRGPDTCAPSFFDEHEARDSQDSPIPQGCPEKFLGLFVAPCEALYWANDLARYINDNPYTVVSIDTTFHDRTLKNSEIRHRMGPTACEFHESIVQRFVLGSEDDPQIPHARVIMEVGQSVQMARRCRAHLRNDHSNSHWAVSHAILFCQKPRRLERRAFVLSYALTPSQLDLNVGESFWTIALSTDVKNGGFNIKTPGAVRPIKPRQRAAVWLNNQDLQEMRQRLLLRRAPEIWTMLDEAIELQKERRETWQMFHGLRQLIQDCEDERERAHALEAEAEAAHSRSVRSLEKLDAETARQLSDLITDFSGVSGGPEDLLKISDEAEEMEEMRLDWD